MIQECIEDVTKINENTKEKQGKERKGRGKERKGKERGGGKGKVRT